MSNHRSELEQAVLLLEIDYQGQTYYLSDTAITNENVYWPYIAEFPSFSISGEGYSRVSFGGLSIIRDEKNDFHPFSGSRYQELLTSVQKIDFRLFLNLERTSLFDGSLAIESVSETEISFSIIEKDYESYVVEKVLDEERRIVEKFLFRKDGDKYTLFCVMPDNEFTDSQQIIFERKSFNQKLDKLIYDRTEKNYFIVDQRKIDSFVLLLEEDALTVIDADYLGIETGADGPSELEQISSSQMTEFGLTGSNIYYQLIDDDVSPAMHWIGTPVENPFSFGLVTIRDPVIKKGGTLEIVDGKVVYDSNSSAATGTGLNTNTNQTSTFTTILSIEPKKTNISPPNSANLTVGATT